MKQECRKKPRRPLSVWELPKLLTPVHTYRRTKRKAGPVRAHFAAILGFVYRNRFVVASQVQRRFASYLPSDRTARRHLAELQNLSWLDTVPTRSVGPLFPKVYFVTGRGVRKLRDAYAEKGIDWHPTVIDRRGRKELEGYTSEHVLHEVLITEFLLDVWQEAESLEDLTLLQVQRRSLCQHPAFLIAHARRRTRLIPDGMFVLRDRDKGMCCCFIELDLGTMGRRQMAEKFARYDRWARSDIGKAFLIDLYRWHGAQQPRPTFRILVVANGKGEGDNFASRCEVIREVNAGFGSGAERVWISDSGNFVSGDCRCMTAAVWHEASQGSGIKEGRKLFG